MIGAVMSNDTIGIGVIGYGYWGPNLVRNFAGHPSARLVGVSDLDSEKLAASRRLYPGVATTSCYDELLKNPAIDAIAIATPVHTHYELALSALKAGKHVLVEKPLAQSSDLVRRLIDEADRRGLTLMVDHTFVYTPAVQKIRELLLKKELGRHLLLRQYTLEPRPVPERCKCNLGSGGPRHLDHPIYPG